MKHEELLSKLTPEEKAALLSGKTVWQTRDIPRLKIPSIFLSDGPHGIRKQAGAGDHLGLRQPVFLQRRLSLTAGIRTLGKRLEKHWEKRQQPRMSISYWDRGLI